jgi:hypothetical protein
MAPLSVADLVFETPQSARETRVMQGETPLQIMHSHGRRAPRHSATAVPRRRRPRRLWPVMALPAIIILLAAGWTGLWYYAANVADRTLSGWVERETAAGRTYSCASQEVTGFPFRIEAHCVAASADINSSHPPFAVSAQNVTFAAQVFRPTLLVGQVTGPLKLAESDQPPSYIANWSRAQITVHGLPPEPDRVSVALHRPHVDHVGATQSAMLFQADSANLDSRIIGGTPSNNPVIDADLRFTAAVAPSVHPLFAAPLTGEIDVVLRGFKDLTPKRWSERFREMQAAGGSIEIRALRIDRADATIVANGTLTMNEDGKLDGQLQVAIAGIERIVPLLGVDKAIGNGLDRLAGLSGQSPQGLGALDRLMPGLGDMVRDTANSSLIGNIEKMGQPTEIDKKPAIVLPLRFSNGSIYLGMLPLGDVPALF